MVASTLNEESRAAVAAELQPTLVELIDLQLTAKQLHWAVVGPRFRPLHDQLDELTDAYRTWSDDVAERLTATGVVPDGRLQRAAADTPLDGLGDGWISDGDAVRAIAARVQQVATAVRDRIERLDKVDLASQDTLLGILAGLEEQLWMLTAQES